MFYLEPIPTGDLSIWIKLGLDSIDNLKIISQDSYTVSETNTMVYPVLISLIYGFLHKIGGLELVAAIHALIPATWLYFWYKFVTKLRKDTSGVWNLQTLAIFLIASQGLTLVYLPRPAMVSTVFILATYYMVTAFKNNLFNTKTILQLVLLEIVWVNIHGSFLILPLMLVWQLPFLLLDKEYNLFRNRLKTIGFTLLAALANPFTWNIFPYVLETAAISKARKIDEWFPTHYFNFPFASWYFFVMSAVLVFLLLYKFRTRRNITELFSDSFFMFWFSGFFAIRNTFFVFLILPIFVFGKIFLNSGSVIIPKNRFSSLYNVLIVALVTTLTILLNPYLKKEFHRFLPSKYQATYDTNYRPEKIIGFLENANGNIFNTWEFGSDLALGQKNKYFIDTRNIIFPVKIENEYVNFLYEPEKNRDFQIKYRFKYYVIHSGYSNLIDWLTIQPDFKLIIDESPALLFEKVDNLAL